MKFREGVDRGYSADRIRAQLRPSAYKSTGTRIIYCPTCKGPVVDSPQARKKHAMNKPDCAAAIS